MKTNCWLVLATMVATSAVAQVDTNNLPAIPAPATTAAATPEAALAAEPVSAPAKKKAAPKKHVVVKKIYEPIVSLLPGAATVAATHLNLRGQAGLKGEALGQLKDGETVNVISQINLDKHALDEPSQWAKISLPADVKVWVSSHFVDAATKTVTAKRINLRAGPGENFSVLGVIEKGATVNVLSTQGTWEQIEAPADSFAFVAAMYLKQNANLVAAAPTQPAVETPAVVPVPASTAPTPVNVAETQPPIVNQSGTTGTGTATETGAATEAGADVGTGGTTGATAATTPNTSGDAVGTAGKMPTTVDTNPPPPRIVSHEGYVRSSISPVAPTPYELFDWDTGNVINYLYSPTPDLDLSRYKENRVIVTGAEGMTPRWAATPVLTIQKIFVTATGYPDFNKRLSSPRASQKNISGTQPLNRR